MKYYATVDGQEFVIEVGQDNQLIVDGVAYDIDFRKMPGSGVTSLIINHRSLEAIVEEKNNAWQVLIHGDLYEAAVEDERSRRLASARGELGLPDGDAAIRSPMPGIVLAVPVMEGQSVSAGEKVVILESMKMENELRSPRDGIVAQIHIEAGASVEKDQLLILITD